MRPFAIRLGKELLLVIVMLKLPCKTFLNSTTEHDYACISKHFRNRVKGMKLAAQKTYIGYKIKTELQMQPCSLPNIGNFINYLQKEGQRK